MTILSDIKKCAPSVYESLNRTPVVEARRLFSDSFTKVLFKLENYHKTGSFKERGVVSFLSQMKSKLPSQGVCAASAGNHALALSYHCFQRGIPCTIVVPKSAPAVKVQKAEELRAQVIIKGANFDEAYAYARSLAKKEGFAFIPPFNDRYIICGQGTIGLEIIEEDLDIDAVFVPIGGGGLISGIAAALKESKKNVKIIGVRAPNSYYGTGVPLLPPAPLADGIAVKDLGSQTKPIIKKYVDEILTVDPEEVARALIDVLSSEHLLIEGAAAAAVAPLFRQEIQKQFQRPLVIMSGSNIDPDRLGHLIFRSLAQRNILAELEIIVPDQPGILSQVSQIIANEGANIISISHRRSFTCLPGMAHLLCTIQVKRAHEGSKIRATLENAGFETRLLEQQCSIRD
jgi:threonine dehydratase